MFRTEIQNGPGPAPRFGHWCLGFRICFGFRERHAPGSACGGVVEFRISISARGCCLPLCLLVLLAGCSQPQVTKRPPVVEQASATEPSVAPVAEDTAKTAIASGPVTFAPVKIGILPLTELSGPSGAGPGAKLGVFVTMLDAFGCQMKAPGRPAVRTLRVCPAFRPIEGKAMALWPQIDLTGPAENNRYWRDFLRPTSSSWTLRPAVTRRTSSK